MKKHELVIGHHINDRLVVKSIVTSKNLDWLKWLDTKEVVEFFEELLKLLAQISEGKKDAATLSIFLADWRETALINSEKTTTVRTAKAKHRESVDVAPRKMWS